MTAPFDRSAAIARVGFLMPGLTDAGLALLVKAADAIASGRHVRDLTPATLAAEQSAREAVSTVAECFARAEAAGTLVTKDCGLCTVTWPDGSPCDAPAAETDGEHAWCTLHGGTGTG